MKRRKLPTEKSPYVTIALALNYFDPDQREMIDHIEKRTNYSEYLKRLVLRDMEGRVTSSMIVPESTDTMDRSLMSGVI